MNSPPRGPMRYVRDVPAGDDAAIAAEREHVVAHLSAVASAEDDPYDRAADVATWVVKHPEDPGLVRIVGELDAAPDAPYLRGDYDPWAGIPPELREVAGG